MRACCARVELTRPLRVRTALRLSAEAQRFPALEVILTAGKTTADGKHPLAVLALGASVGARVDVVVTGPDAGRVLGYLVAILRDSG